MEKGILKNQLSEFWKKNSIRICSFLFLSLAFTIVQCLLYVEYSKELGTLTAQQNQEIAFQKTSIENLLESNARYENRVSKLDDLADSAIMDLDDALYELEMCEAKPPKIEKVILHRGISYKDLFKLVYNVMVYLGEENPVDFTTLLMVTHIAESNGGQHLYQMNNGPARGVFQVEPTTEKEIYRVFLARNPVWKEKIEALKGVEIQGLENNVYNLAYNAAMAWCVYKWRIPNGTPPNKDDVQKQAEYHKKYYNTIHGDASVTKTLEKLGEMVSMSDKDTMFLDLSPVPEIKDNSFYIVLRDGYGQEVSRTEVSEDYYKFYVSRGANLV